jgi:hypothetical protein
MQESAISQFGRLTIMRAEMKTVPERPSVSGQKSNGQELLDKVPYRFCPLNEAERKLVVAASSGERVVLRLPGGVCLDCTVRADVIHWLCTDRVAKALVGPGGIWVQGAVLKEELNLSWAKIPFPILLIDSELAGTTKLTGAQIPLLGLDGSIVPNLDADSIQVRGSVYLRHGFASSGEVNLIGAQIGGDLDCSGGGFTVLKAGRAEIKGALVWRQIKRPLPQNAAGFGTLRPASKNAMRSYGSLWRKLLGPARIGPKALGRAVALEPSLRWGT